MADIFNELVVDMSEFLLLIIPFLVIEIGLKIYCLVQLSKNGANHMPKWVWALIIIFVTTFGPVVYLFAGKRKY